MSKKEFKSNNVLGKKIQGRTLPLFDVGPFSFSRQADVGHF